ncbi:RNA polymerase sigma factor [Dethiothermospora halolimnae]|uniref:RNA polymerase sigma factor n=1 Tax=Dethiothermospora halolimnae TaxID=3114390 RepID=UPI003CCC3CB9
MNEDKILLEGFKSGNPKSFENLIIKYRQKGINFAKKYLHDYYLAEDIVQESFAEIYVYRDRYDPKYSFKSYLYSIIRNKSVDYIRKNHSIPVKEISLTTEDTPEKSFFNKDRKNTVIEKINQMKMDYRMAIYLVEYEELSYKEIAKIMNKNMTQVKILIYRARKKLKNLLEGEV